MKAAIDWFNRYFPWIALTLVALGIALAVRRDAPAVAELEWQSAWRPMLLAAAAFAVAPLAQAISFWLVLRFLRARAPFGDAMRIWAHSYVLRYAPSGALAVVYRVRAKARLGATRDQVLTAEAYEHLGALVAGAIACVAGFGLVGALPPPIGLAAALPVLAVAVALHPRLLGEPARRFLRRFRVDAAVLRGRELAVVAGVNVVAWASTGAGMLVVAEGLTGDPGPGLRWAIGTYAAGYLIGFVVPFLPGGLGAREAALVLLVSPHYGLGAATAIVLALRVAVTLGELVAVGVLLGASPRSASARRRARRLLIGASAP